MMDILSIMSENELFFYVIIIMLVFIAICLFVLIFNQNKQLEARLTKDIDDKIEDMKEEAIDQIDTKELPIIKEEIETLDEEITNGDINEEVPISISELENLQSLTKELELAPKMKAVNLTQYEVEQEERAIISYDELISKSDNVSIVYSDTNTNDNVLVKKVDLEKTGKIELDPIKKEINSRVNVISYEHEESFLNALKDLQDLLN
ncbi:MAG: hypothetical protein ACI4WW_04310 [Candidatus Coprovivens sp.]